MANGIAVAFGEYLTGGTLPHDPEQRRAVQLLGLLRALHLVNSQRDTAIEEIDRLVPELFKDDDDFEGDDE